MEVFGGKKSPCLKYIDRVALMKVLARWAELIREDSHDNYGDYGGGGGSGGDDDGGDGDGDDNYGDYGYGGGGSGGDDDGGDGDGDDNYGDYGGGGGGGGGGDDDGDVMIFGRVFRQKSCSSLRQKSKFSLGVLLAISPMASSST